MDDKKVRKIKGGKIGDQGRAKRESLKEVPIQAESSRGEGDPKEIMEGGGDLARKKKTSFAKNRTK